MAIADFTQDPASRLDYAVDWSSWLVAGDTISSSSWSVSDPVLIIDTSSNTSTTTTVFAKFPSAVIKSNYMLTNLITTVQGRINTQSIRLTAQKA